MRRYICPSTSIAAQPSKSWQGRSPSWRSLMCSQGHSWLHASRMKLPVMLPSSFLLLMELRSSCCRTEAPSSCRRPAESGRSPAGTPRRLLCSPWGPLEAASHAPLDLQMSPALLPPGRGSLQGLTKRDYLPGEPRRHSITNPLCRVFLASSTTQSQLQEKH